MFVVFPAVIIVIASALLGSFLFFFGMGLVWNAWHFARTQTDPKEEGGERSRSRKSTR